MTCPGCPACAASRQQFIVTTTANVKAKNVEEALLDLFAGDEYEVRAASPPPEPQEIWRARADAAVEALAFLAAHRRWDDGEHSMRVYAQEQLQSIARGEYLPPEPQGTDEERSE
jgi:hypothetical protein